MAFINRGVPFNATANVSGANATATQAGVANGIFYITDISGASGGNGTIQVIGGATGSTVLWGNLIAGSTPVVVSFQSPLKGTIGSPVSVYVQGITGPSYANISGYRIDDA